MAEVAKTWPFEPTAKTITEAVTTTKSEKKKRKKKNKFCDSNSQYFVEF